MKLSTGESRIKFILPKKMPSGTLTLHVKNLINEDSTNFNSPNNAPEASDISVSTEQNAERKIDVAFYVSDADILDIVSLSPCSSPSHGSASISSDKLSILYTPQQGYVGNDTFSYTVNDGNGGTATANVYVSVQQVVEKHNFEGTFCIIRLSRHTIGFVFRRCGKCRHNRCPFRRLCCLLSLMEKKGKL